MTNKDLKLNSIGLITAIISVLLLIAVIIFSVTSRVSANEVADMQLTAEDLVAANFDTASYFGISSLTVAEGYKAEDYPEGTAPCSTNIFSSYDELADFIKSTYVPTTAAILLNSEVNGVKRYFNYNNELCMAVVDPDLTYNKDWSAVKIKLSDIKKKSADISVTMNSKDSQEPQTITLTMIKQGDKWLLNNLVY